MIPPAAVDVDELIKFWILDETDQEQSQLCHRNGILNRDGKSDLVDASCAVFLPLLSR
jgi:hypothetical protein